MTPNTEDTFNGVSISDLGKCNAHGAPEARISRNLAIISSNHA